ncbi:MAG: hypothetical protein H6834_10215 [Planctomycetes bacterium]|nr:hypothetical protein [Planctomycetota bacterium]
MVHQRLLGSVLILSGLLAGPLAAQAKRGDSHFDTLSKGHPTARKILEALNDDTATMLKDLMSAFGARTHEKSKTVTKWNVAISQHLDSFTTKVEEAKQSAAELEKQRGLPGNWPADWKIWGNIQRDYFNELKDKRFIDWKFDLWDRIHKIEDGLEKDPLKFDELKKEATWVDEQMDASREALGEATTKRDVEAELKRFTRIWTTTSNLQRVLVKRKKYIDEFFGDPDAKVDAFKKGAEAMKTWWHEVEGRKLLDPMCKQAAGSFAINAVNFLEIYEKKYDEVKKMNAPILEQTLLKDVATFRGVDFDQLVKTVEVHEKALHAKLDALK